MHSLTLLVPGLLGPDVRITEDFVPEVPALKLILARADHNRHRSRGVHHSIAGLFDQEQALSSDVPVAAVSRLNDNEHDTRGLWIRADPVHLSPDRDRLVLMDSFVLNLTQHDALAVANEVNQVISVHGWSVEVPYEDRWYIRLDEELSISTTELPRVVGQDISGYLPVGDDASMMHTLLNEIQMHLFSSDINRMREEKGELPVNSIWFWGMGRLPDPPGKNWSKVFSDDTFTRSLAGLAGIPCHAVPQHVLGIQEFCGEDDDVLVYLQHCQAPTQYQNLELWNQALLLLEGAWFETLLQWLRTGRLDSLRIICDDHDFMVSRFKLKKFWRKPVAINNYNFNR